MATKDELSAVKADLEAGINRLESKVDNFMDSEFDKRKQLEVRVSKIETNFFPNNF
jgi:hypothetical protein